MPIRTDLLAGEIAVVGLRQALHWWLHQMTPAERIEFKETVLDDPERRKAFLQSLLDALPVFDLQDVYAGLIDAYLEAMTHGS